ncbi:MAG: hypothetical protein H6706_21745 [Myxococcales bacterium]|nr:hypothetical protein [Myxococcales bacterium]
MGGGAGGEGGMGGGAGGMGGEGGGMGGAGGQPQDPCALACDRVAECAIGEGLCPGFADEAQEDFRDGCYESCSADGRGEQAAGIVNLPTCEAVIAAVSAIDEGFAGECAGGELPIDCEVVCARLSTDCAGLPDGAERDAAIVECTAECQAEDISEEVLRCVLGAACEAVSACVDEAPPPDPVVVAECRALCGWVPACLGAPEPVDLDECANDCAQGSTAGQRACLGAANQACEAVEACLMEDQGPVAAECAEACGILVTCQGADIPPDQVAVARQQCQEGCVAESTAAERACVIATGGECLALEGCFGG